MDDTPQETMLTARLDEETSKALAYLVQASRRNRSEVVRQLILAAAHNPEFRAVLGGLPVKLSE